MNKQTVYKQMWLSRTTAKLISLRQLLEHVVRVRNSINKKQNERKRTTRLYVVHIRRLITHSPGTIDGVFVSYFHLSIDLVVAVEG